MQRRRYWINTSGKKRIFFSLVTRVPDEIVSMMYELKECSWFVYILFRITKINLLAKDKFAWLRNS